MTREQTDRTSQLRPNEAGIHPRHRLSKSTSDFIDRTEDSNGAGKTSYDGNASAQGVEMRPALDIGSA